MSFNPAILARGGGYARRGGLCGPARFAFHDLACGVILLALAAGGIVWATDMRLLHLFEKNGSRGRSGSAPPSPRALGRPEAGSGVASGEDTEGPHPALIGHPVPHKNGRGASNFKPHTPLDKVDKTADHDVVSGPSPIPMGEGWPKAGVGADDDDLPTIPVKIAEPKPGEA